MARKLRLNGQEVTLPQGVEVRGNRIRIGFTYRGRYCYETLPGEPAIASVKRAGVKRAAIMLEIEEGRFSYRHHFPDSKKALKIDGISQSQPNATIGEMLEEEANIAKEYKSPSTLKSELPRHRYIREYFGSDMQVRHVTPEDVERFKRHLLTAVTPKTGNNVLVPLRSILKRAHARGILLSSIHDRFEGFTGEDIRPSKELLPLSLDEMCKFSSVEIRPTDRDMFLFNCWVGLSISELIALAWEDVDTSQAVWTITIRRARVDNAWKVPKERSRERTIELNSKAQSLLALQRAKTQLYPTMTVNVTQRDNVATISESITPVFRNSVSGGTWNPKSLDRIFRYLCRKAAISVRGPNQTRHTFASRMLTAGLPTQLLARLMGHTTEAMIHRHYGRWIAEDVKGRVGRLMDQVIANLE